METTSLYIHIPFCTSKCTYCDFYSIPLGNDFNVCESSQNLLKNYILAIKNEIKFRISQFDIKLLKTIYIGGGTPSLISIKDINEILEYIKTLCEIHKNAEITLESNPQDINTYFIEQLRETPVNRLSVGIQCYNDYVLKKLKRRCNLNQIDIALKIIKENWVDFGYSFSCDLISGLPYLSDEDFVLGINKVINYGANHISLYSLMIEENTPLYNEINSEEIFYSEEKNENQWILGRNLLEKKGFLQYEVSNFAKPSYESMHNSVYWQIKNYLGVGAGATGTVDFYRWNNLCDIKKYVDFWFENTNKNDIPQEIENLSIKDKEFEFLMMGFRLKVGIKASDYFALFSSDLANRLGYNKDCKKSSNPLGTFDKWINKKYADVEKLENDIRFFLTKDGLLFLNQFLEEIM